MVDVPAVVAISGGESPSSKTRALSVALLDAAGGGRLFDLSELPADGLLGRAQDDAVDEAVQAAQAAGVLIIASPVYRATVSGAVKGFLDRFPAEGLRGVAVVLAATAAVPQHYLSLDTSGRALVASLGGLTVPTVVYGTSADFVEGVPGPSLTDLVDRAAAEAVALADVLRS